jgi:hypothetical protein
MATMFLNDARIKALKVKPGRRTTDYFDQDVEHLVVRVSSTGRKTFYVWYRLAKGGPVKWVQVTDPTLKVQHHDVMTLANARRLAKDLLRSAYEGRDPGAERAAAEVQRAAAQAFTFKELGARFINEYAKAPRPDGRPKRKSWREYERIIRLRLTPLHDIPVEDLTRRAIRDVLDAMTARGVGVYANRTKSCVSKVLNWAVERNWLEVNPLGPVTANEEVGRHKVLDDAEVRTYWAWFDAPPADATDKRKYDWPLLAAWARLRLVTLARSNEVLSMEWAHLEGVFKPFTVKDPQGKRPVWIIPDTKNGKEHLIPLSPMAVEIIKSVRQAQTAHAAVNWPGPRRDAGLAFAGIQCARDRRNVFRGSGLVDFEPRDARRTAATNMGALDVDEFDIERVLNHSRRGLVTARYNRWKYEPQKRAALNAWAAHLARLVRPLRIVQGTARKRGAA